MLKENHHEERGQRKASEKRDSIYKTKSIYLTFYIVTILKVIAEYKSKAHGKSYISIRYNRLFC